MTYLYKCTKCEAETEHVHSMKETPSLVCATDGAALRRMIARAPEVSLKGGCWFRDGYDRTLQNDYKRGTPGSES